MFVRRFIRSSSAFAIFGAALAVFAQMGWAQTNVDVVLSGRDTPDPVTTGQTLVYFLNVTNDGPAAATGVHLTDVIPKKLR